MPERQIVQVCTISDPGPRHWGVIALAGDGTLWVKTINAFDPTMKLENGWRQLETLPAEGDGSDA